MAPNRWFYSISRNMSQYDLRDVWEGCARHPPHDGAGCEAQSLFQLCKIRRQLQALQQVRRRTLRVRRRQHVRHRGEAREEGEAHADPRHLRGQRRRRTHRQLRGSGPQGPPQDRHDRGAVRQIHQREEGNHPQDRGAVADPRRQTYFQAREGSRHQAGRAVRSAAARSLRA